MNLSRLKAPLSLLYLLILTVAPYDNINQPKDPSRGVSPSAFNHSIFAFVKHNSCSFFSILNTHTQFIFATDIKMSATSHSLSTTLRPWFHVV